jgi:glycosyltransferase involved in cell wall biosynthesis
MRRCQCNHRIVANSNPPFRFALRDLETEPKVSVKTMAEINRGLETCRLAKVSVVTPTLHRPDEVQGLLQNLCGQTVLPFEVILVDGAPATETETERTVEPMVDSLPFSCRYIRHGGGTAVQRNVGIDAAMGDFVAFVDDDVRLEPDFIEAVLWIFRADAERKIGGIVGYRSNEHAKHEESVRWRWYRRFKFFTTYEPGRYDFETGYPINANAQPSFSGVRPVDFMTTSCALWRREVLDSGLRFDDFFSDYGVLEDAHFSLRAGRRWQLLQCGDARCSHLSSTNGRVDRRKLGYKYVVNYYYVFKDIVRPLTLRRKVRFWRFQAFELFRIITSAVRRRRLADLKEFQGRIEGIAAIVRGLGISHR